MRACVVCAVLLAAARAQEVGSLAGTVTDLAGAVIPGARLTLRGTSGEIAQIQSGGQGEFRFPKLPPGTYSVEASASGLTTESAKDLKVASGAETTVKIAMEVEDRGGVMIRACEGGPKTRSEPIQSTISEIAGVVGFDWRPAGDALITVNGPMLMAETRPKHGGPPGSTRTDKHGNFKLPIQEPGSYTVTAHKEGYADFLVEDVEARKGQRTVIQKTIALDLCQSADRCEPERKFPLCGIGAVPTAPYGRGSDRF